MLRLLAFIVPRLPSRPDSARAPAADDDFLIRLGFVLGTAFITAMVYGLWEILRGRARQVSVNRKRLVVSASGLVQRCLAIWVVTFLPGFGLFLIWMAVRWEDLPLGVFFVFIGATIWLFSLLYLLFYDSHTTFSGNTRTVHRGRRQAPFTAFSHVLVHPKGGFLGANPDPRFAISLESATPLENLVTGASQPRPTPFRRICVTGSETEIFAAAKTIADFTGLPIQDLRAAEPPRAT